VAQFVECSPLRRILGTPSDPIYSVGILSALVETPKKATGKPGRDPTKGSRGVIQPQKNMPAISLEDFFRAIVTRKQAPQVSGLSQSTIDRLRADGKLPAILDDSGRVIAFFREDVLALVSGAYRAKPGRKAAREHETAR
jgi:predicted DNA-binding transcriptional regulator AlpA